MIYIVLINLSPERVDTTVIEPQPLLGNLAQPCDEFRIVLPMGLVAARRALEAHELACAALGVPSRLEVVDPPPSHGGDHHFFPRVAFSESTSSANCATSFFSFAFSSSRRRFSFASNTLIPLKRSRQRLQADADLARDLADLRPALPPRESRVTIYASE